MRKYKTIIDYRGDVKLLKNCKKIKGSYYEKGESCFFINGKWHSINSSYIFYDNRLKKYREKRNVEITRGIYEIDENGIFKIGLFSICPYNTVTIILDKYYSDSYMFPDKRILKDLGYVESIFSDVWINSENKEFILKYNRLIFHSCKNYSYNIEDNITYQKSLDLYKNAKIEIDKDTRKASRLIGDITFGIEVEIRDGFIPETYQKQLGIGVCKDGSINYSPEFVSVPYQGVKGLQAMKNFFLEIHKRCDTDYNRSYHVHIGNIRKDREFLISLFRLTQLIQYELFQIVPPYKELSNLKEKNYCKPVKNIVPKYNKESYCNYSNFVKTFFIKMQSFILGGTLPNKRYNRKTKVHPNGQNKWNYGSRYYIINFVNMFLSKRNTIEFRLHHSVISPIKNINWFFICVAIIKYAEKNSFKILNSDKISLKEIIDVFEDKEIANYLNAYIDNRKDYFGSCDQEDDCYLDANEKDFQFKFGNIDSIY